MCSVSATGEGAEAVDDDGMGEDEDVEVPYIKVLILICCHYFLIINLIFFYLVLKNWEK
jgi:hypothetical protein